MRTADFEYDLPPELIAQHPVAQRDMSRLLVLNRASERLEHRLFREFPEFFRAGDVLVLNNTRVIPARLRGINDHTGGKFEMLLLEENSANDWWVMLRPGKRARIGTQIKLVANAKSESAKKNLPSPLPQIRALVTGVNAEGHRRLKFECDGDLRDALCQFGETPLPPYIARTRNESLADDDQRYQTVFAERAGSVAAPTAGLHFTDAVLEKIRARGVQIEFVTLHVGMGTFAPVKAGQLADHVMHDERYELGETTARAITDAKTRGGRVIAVGTTSVRVLESVAREHHGRLVPGQGRTRIFIHPPFEFKIVDALLTNFHLPCSTLLMLVSAFAAPSQLRGRELILSAYAEAIRERYRFFSYGDAMLIL